MARFGCFGFCPRQRSMGILRRGGQTLTGLRVWPVAEWFRLPLSPGTRLREVAALKQADIRTQRQCGGTGLWPSLSDSVTPGYR